MGPSGLGPQDDKRYITREQIPRGQSPLGMTSLKVRLEPQGAGELLSIRRGPDGPQDDSTYASSGRFGSAASVSASAIAPSSGYWRNSVSGAFTLEPVSMLLSCSAFTAALDSK